MLNMAENKHSKAGNTPMTNEERLKLAEKLDSELDEFIAGLEKRSYSEGWPEDRWEEEMEKHPFFMSKVPEDGKLNPLLEGIQQLKYDETENTPLELATAYKEDGNFNFKCKKYRMAIISYTEGIMRHCGDVEIEAQLYSNRATAQFYLENYRSSLSDCRRALKIKPEHMKAKVKAAQCCVKLKLFPEAIAYCDEVLMEKPTEPSMLKTRAEAVNSHKVEERNKRKTGVQSSKLKSELAKLKAAIDNRGVKLEVEGCVLESLELLQERPKLENEELFWPVFFLYPEYSMSDYIEEFSEKATFSEQLHVMFDSSPEWDRVAEYKANNLSVYHEGIITSQLHQVDVNHSLGQVLSSERFVVRQWKPSFLIFVKGSSSEKNFLKTYDIVM